MINRSPAIANKIAIHCFMGLNNAYRVRYFVNVANFFFFPISNSTRLAIELLNI